MVLTASQVDVLALNRALGLGLYGPVGEEQLDAVLEALRESGVPRAFVPLAPGGRRQQLATLLEARGLSVYNNWVRLTRLLDEVPDAPESGLEVREISRESAADFGRIVTAAFGFPPAVAPLAEQAIGRQGWRHYLAFDGRTPVACGAMYLTAGTAWLGFAATDAAHRRRGAQQALVVRRMRDAAAAGCHQVSVETAEDSVVKDAPSFRNLRRVGFSVAYIRPNYLWSRPAR